jgi:hypothetical protein
MRWPSGPQAKALEDNTNPATENIRTARMTHLETGRVLLLQVSVAAGRRQLPLGVSGISHLRKKACCIAHTMCERELP